MTPDEVVAAMATGDALRVRAVASPEFNDQVGAEEISRVWSDAVARLGAFEGTGDALELHDIPLKFHRGDAHLQIAYRAGHIVGLVLKPGAPTGRFGD